QYKKHRLKRILRILGIASYPAADTEDDRPMPTDQFCECGLIPLDQITGNEFAVRRTGLPQLPQDICRPGHSRAPFDYSPLPAPRVAHATEFLADDAGASGIIRVYLAHRRNR